MKPVGSLSWTPGQTSYIFRVAHGDYPIHDYYGKEITDYELPDYQHGEIRSFAPYPQKTGIEFSLDTVLQEYPFFGSGDFRASALRLEWRGNQTTLFKYSGFRIFAGRAVLKELPCSRADSRTETLEVTLEDKASGCVLKLYYTLFPDTDMIAKHAVLQNRGTESVRIYKIMSGSLDIPSPYFDMVVLGGTYGNERKLKKRRLSQGIQSACSRRGASGHQINPFTAIAAPDADENHGDVYAFNLVYSGNFLNEAEVDQYGNTRVTCGINPEGFSWTLDPGESFETPELLFTYAQGFGEMSRRFHDHIRTHIIEERFLSERRPVLLNTWEACFFAIDEDILIDFAKSAKPLGIDMLVMDDGWFGSRKNDSSGLGDWAEAPEKFKNGLKNFIDTVHKTGLGFGIWIEPEMVNPDSDLFRAHPEWCLQAEGRESSLSRNQLVLDMGNPEVTDYLEKSFTRLFKECDIQYVKWDMNRHLSEAGSSILPQNRQSEVFHRYVIGVYRLFGNLKSKFPNILFESCSGGGGRFDLGMLAFSPQIWTSDNTGPYERVAIQYGTSFAYPVSAMGAHVAANFHWLPGRSHNLDFRYKTASFGVLGYELNITKMTEEELAEIKSQIEAYKEIEHLIQKGDLYRLISPFQSNRAAAGIVSKDKKEAAVWYWQLSGESNGPVERLKLDGLDPERVYEVTGDLSGRFTGDTLMYAGLRFPILSGDGKAIFLRLSSILEKEESFHA